VKGETFHSEFKAHGISLLCSIPSGAFIGIFKRTCVNGK
jgi:hypothetical protein